jgi:hypothetical protein
MWTRDHPDVTRCKSLSQGDDFRLLFNVSLFDAPSTTTIVSLQRRKMPARAATKIIGQRRFLSSTDARNIRALDRMVDVANCVLKERSRS